MVSNYNKHFQCGNHLLQSQVQLNHFALLRKLEWVGYTVILTCLTDQCSMKIWMMLLNTRTMLPIGAALPRRWGAYES